MKSKIIVAITLCLFVFSSIMAKDLTGIKIYINPGHGGYDSTPGVLGDDRFVPTIPFPDKTEDAFWESSCNLVKGLELKRLLEAAGATVKISRTKNTTADDKVLSTISAEANNFGADAFISIHSNQLGTNAGTNYFLNVYNADRDEETGEYGLIGKNETLIAECKEMATQSAEYFKSNNLTTWNTSSTYQIAEDYNVLGYTLGVLIKLTVPGFVLESSFHDYEPETHRLLNDDYAKLTAWDLFRFYCDYFGADKPQTGVIAGAVKDGAVVMSHEYYNNWKSGTHDRFQPINGATVTLYNSENELVATYNTDQYYNGVFVFRDLTPGNYTVQMDADGYDRRTKAVTVVAGETTSFVELMYEEITPNIIATSVNGEQDNSVYNISFMLNGTPEEVALTLYDVDGKYLETIELEGTFKKGANKVSIDLSKFEKYYNVMLKWGIAIKAEKESSWRCISAIANGHDAVPEEQLTSYPNAIVVDNNPKSNYFGRIYMLNGTTTYTGTYKSLGVGVYAYNSYDFSMINENFEPYTGNVNWSGKVGNSMNYVCLSPHTMAIDDDGYVYISDWTDWNSGVWIMNPANPTGDFIPVFNVGNNGSGTVYNDNGEYVHGSISGLCVVGTGDDRVLYTVDEDYSEGTAILKYKIGDLSQLPYTGTPEVVYLLGDNSTLNGVINSYLTPDRKGGFWFAQRNIEDTKAESPYKGAFNLLHFTSSGFDSDLGLITDWYSRTDKNSSVNTMGIATNSDGSRLAIGVYAAIGMKNVDFNADGTVVKTTFSDVSDEYIKGYDKNLTKTAGNYMNHMTWSIAFDNADNVYVADWSDYLQAYSLGKEENRCETMSKDIINMVTVGIDESPIYSTNVTYKDGVIIVMTTKEKSISIYNLQGELLHDEIAHKTTQCIDISMWDSGIYLLKVGEETVKLIK